MSPLRVLGCTGNDMCTATEQHVSFCPANPSHQPLSEGGFKFSDRRRILCRTCLCEIAWETRTEPGYLPRTGWYDEARSDPLVCFKARDYRHVPLTDREWAYYEAGRAEGRDHAREPRRDDIERGGASRPEKDDHE